MSRRQTLQENLLAAGERGLTSLELAEAVGHRFAARLHELRRDGHEIVREPVRGAPGLWRYRLTALPDGSAPTVPAYEPGKLLTVRRAWPLLGRLLGEQTPAARAQVADILLRQPGLARNRSVRHCLGAAKTRRLDEIAAALVTGERA